jgi:hypothetical protein
MRPETERSKPMGNVKWDRNTCEGCIKANNNDPKQVPCMKIRNLSSPGLALIPQNLIGWACCPFTASWEDVKSAANGTLDQSKMTGYAARLLTEIRPKIAKYANQPDQCGYLKGDQSTNNPHTFITDDRKLTVWIRKLPGRKEEEFYNWFLANGLEVPVGQMTTFQKLKASALLAIDKLPEEGKKVVQELIGSLPLLIALLGALALSPQKYVAFFRAVFYGFGIVTQIKDYLSSFGGWLAYACGATTFRELDKAAEFLAHFVAMALADLGIASLERFIGFLKTRSAKEFDEAAQKGYQKEGGAEAKAGNGEAKLGEVASKAGMREMHLSRWSTWCKRNKSLAVLRTSERTSLPRHLDMLTTGKPMEIKWKTAKSGPWAGLVTVPDTRGMSPEDVKKLMAEIETLRQKGYKFYPPDAPPGALITKDGYAFCSDVDKMGIYQQAENGALKPHPNWQGGPQANDSPANQAWLNEEIYKFITMDNHGAQDFFKKPVGPNGKLKPGRYPDADEDFVVIHPDGRVEYIPSVGELKLFYERMGIAWPY